MPHGCGETLGGQRSRGFGPLSWGEVGRPGEPFPARAGDMPPEAAEILFLVDLAVGWLEQEEAAMARSLLEEAAGRAAAVAGRREQGLVEMYFCRLCCLDGAGERAERHGLRALKLLEREGRPGDLAQVTMYLGNVAWLNGRYHEARARYGDALCLARAAADGGLLARVNANLGSLHLLLEDADRALEHYCEALRLLTAAPRDRTHAQIQLGLALAYRDRGELDRAMELALRAQAALREERRPELVADLCSNMGTIYACLGESPRARYCYEQALAVLRGAETVQAAEAQRELARLCLEAGDVARGLYWAENAHRVARGLPDRLEEARCELSLGQALVAANRLREAGPHLQAAARTFESVGMRQSLLVACDLLRYCADRPNEGEV